MFYLTLGIPWKIFFSRIRRDASGLTHLNLMDEGTSGDAARKKK